MMNKNKVGLALGLFFAVMHAVWLLAIAIMPVALQKSLDWLWNLHALNPVWVINTAFLSWANAIMLVIVTFIVGYILGWVFTWCHNMFHKK